MTSGFVAVVPHNKFKHVQVYEVIPATKVHDFRNLLRMSHDEYKNRFPVLGEDRVLEFEQYPWRRRKIEWTTVRYEVEE